MKNNDLFKIVLTAILVAAAIVLGMLTKYVPGLNLEFPQGGSVFGLSMIPIIALGLFLGVGYGAVGGVVYGIVNFLIDGYSFHWASFILDYSIAFGLVGFGAGLFKQKFNDVKSLVFAVLFAGFLRYLSHGLSGALVFTQYAGDNHPFFYSFVLYNLPYMASSTLISLVATLSMRNVYQHLSEDYLK